MKVFDGLEAFINAIGRGFHVIPTYREAIYYYSDSLIVTSCSLLCVMFPLTHKDSSI